jgi:histidyl-tRNA synthetase
MILLPGFRDFYPADCARRNAIVASWRAVCRRYGFVEYDGPMLESTDLYRKKSGGELLGQLFDFTDKGEREVALRPEMTPTLARMVIARDRDFRKPLKWFSIAPFFRYEKQQRGRLREFLQLNCDIIGEPGPAADAELIALAVDLLRELGFTSDDFVVRVSDRNAWTEFARTAGVAEDRLPELLDIIDKSERVPREQTDQKLRTLGTDLDAVEAFRSAGTSSSLAALDAELALRDVAGFVEPDLGIVRGLAYYSGIVFEIWDRKRTLRAVAGGGRYDSLLSLLSDGKVDLPALGFAIGDVVLSELINETSAAREKLDAAMVRESAIDCYIVIAKEEQRAAAIADAQQLRSIGYRVDYPLVPAKVGKQFQTAEQIGARVAILYGDEMPQVKIKLLATREETLAARELLTSRLAELLDETPRHAPPLFA